MAVSDDPTLSLLCRCSVIIAYNDTGIRGVPDVYRPGAKLAFISTIVYVLTLCQRACR